MKSYFEYLYYRRTAVRQSWTQNSHQRACIDEVHVAILVLLLRPQAPFFVFVLHESSALPGCTTTLWLVEGETDPEFSTSPERGRVCVCVQTCAPSRKNKSKRYSIRALRRFGFAKKSFRKVLLRLVDYEYHTAVRVDHTAHYISKDLLLFLHPGSSPACIYEQQNMAPAGGVHKSSLASPTTAREELLDPALGFLPVGIVYAAVLSVLRGQCAV